MEKRLAQGVPMGAAAGYLLSAVGTNVGIVIGLIVLLVVLAGGLE